MNKLLLLIIFYITNLSAQDNTLLTGGNPGLGANGGGAGFNGGYNPNSSPSFSSTNGASIPVFDNASIAPGLNYNLIKPNSNCPLLTQTVKEDQDVLIDLKTYLSTFSRKAECSQNPMSAMKSEFTISTLETMIGNNSSQAVKCYSKNVDQISARNMAYFYAEKGMDQNTVSVYASCNKNFLNADYSPAQARSLDAIKECINSKYEYLVSENSKICSEVAAPQAVQDQINKGMVELERLLVSSLSQTDKCAPDPKDAFKTTMNTFLKVKALSTVGPWGVMAGFGADLIGSLLDKIFPSDSQKASALMDDILSEDNYEQNACLYFTIQQKMYCSNQPLQVDLPTGSCNNINVSSDLINLLQNVKAMKKIAEAADPNANKAQNQNNQMGYYNQNQNNTPAVAAAIDLSKFESALEDLSKYAQASEADIRARVKLLPKIQQGKELARIDRFYTLLNEYQKYDPAKDAGGIAGQKILEELQGLVIGSIKNPGINFDELVLKTTPGLKLDAIRQRGIANSIEQVLMSNSSTGLNHSAESSRSMAKYNKYKNAMGVMAQKQFEERLNKQFKEFENQIKFVTSKEGGVSKDVVSEGMLRNLVRHCSLMQEIYDPKLEGKIPKQCEKLGCGSANKLDWFMPKEKQLNLTQYKSNYCDKSVGFKKVEDDYIRDLYDPKGAKICGKKPEDFF